MKKILHFIAWFAGLAIFLLIAAHFTLRHVLNTPKFKAAATGYIERAVGRTADYERIDYSLFPFSLVVRNASLKESGGTQDFVSMEKFSAIVNFRTHEVTSLRLEKPSIRIVQRPDGTFNFSDLLPPPSAEADPGSEVPSTTAAGESTAAEQASTPAQPSSPVAPPIVLRLVEIENARFEFISMDENQHEETFTLSDLNFQLLNFAPDRPLQMEGRATLGKTSSLQFELSGPALSDFAGNFGSWPVAFTSQLDIRDFADLKAFLPEGTLPFKSLGMKLIIQGALADKLTVRLNLQTPEATQTHPVALELALGAEASLPGPVIQHWFAGAPLPEAMRFAPPPCEPPPGALALADSPEWALLLRHAQATFELSGLKIAYGENRFTDGAATAFLRNGVLTLPRATLSAYGGTLEARGNVQLLTCPLAYRLDRLAVNHLAIEQALAANGLDELAPFSGKLQMDASVVGHTVAEAGLRSLEADVTAHIDDLQSVGTGGSLMDQVWLQLDHPLLLKLVPRLTPKVEHAKEAAATAIPSRYDEVAATLSLRNGTATLSDARLAMPGYRLEASGAILPFDDRLDLAARLVVSPEETARLTDGKDLSAVLPYEKGGLMIPVAIRGSLQKPQVRPDLELLLKNALAGGTDEGSGSLLDELSTSDRKNVQKGLDILGSFLQR